MQGDHHAEVDKMPEFYLNREYKVKLEMLSKITGKSKSQLVREAIDLLFEKYMKELRKG